MTTLRNDRLNNLTCFFVSSILWVVIGGSREKAANNVLSGFLH